MVIDRDPGGGEETDVANSDDTTAGSFGVLFVPRVVDGRTRGSEIQRATAQFSRVVPSRACSRAATPPAAGWVLASVGCYMGGNADFASSR